MVLLLPARSPFVVVVVVVVVAVVVAVVVLLPNFVGLRALARNGFD